MDAGAREGWGSLELVEIFQMRIDACRFTPVCRNRCGASGAGRGRAPSGVYVSLGSLPLWVVLRVQANRNELSTGVWDQQRRARSPGWAVREGG